MDAATLEKAQVMMQAEAKTIQDIEKETNELMGPRQQLLGQINENQSVLHELKLHEQGVVYKLMGPALVRQDPEEAIGNVTKRIEFMQTRLATIEDTLNEKYKTMNEAKQRFMGMQAHIREAREGKQPAQA